MSLGELSTELDSRIASLVHDKSALSAFSLTSKYYRMIAEPYLYKNIEVDEYDYHTLLRLLFTLLDRNELAAYVKSIKYTQGNFGLTYDVAKQGKLRSDVWKYRNAIGEKINELLSPASGVSDISKWRLDWFSAIMSAVHEHHRGYDEVLALVLCMARKIQYLELYSGRSTPMRTLRVLRSTGADSVNPLKNLQHLTLNELGPSMYAVAVLPTLQTLNINRGLPELSTNCITLDYPLPTAHARAACSSSSAVH